MNHKNREANATGVGDNLKFPASSHPGRPAQGAHGGRGPHKPGRSDAQLPKPSLQSLTRKRDAHPAPTEEAPPRFTVCFKGSKRAPEQRRESVIIREAP